MKIVIAAIAGLAVSVSAFGQPDAAKPQAPAAAAQPGKPGADLTKPTLYVVAYGASFP